MTLVKDETKKVLRLAREGAIRSLGRAGAVIRGTAQRSLGKKKGPSRPGSPPRSPTGRLKKAIFFQVDKATQSVVIGPTRSAVGLIGRTHEFGGVEGAKATRPRKEFTLEVGGIGPIRRTKKTTKKGRPRFAFTRLKTGAQVRRAREHAAEFSPAVSGVGKKRRVYPKRPFMGPALERIKARLPSYWRDSVRS